MSQGLNSHYFRMIGDGHQPNSRGLHTHYKDSYYRWDDHPQYREFRPWHIYCTQKLDICSLQVQDVMALQQTFSSVPFQRSCGATLKRATVETGATAVELRFSETTR